MEKPTVIDFFCGCGGLSKGYELAGYNVLAGIDFDDAALRTYEQNHHSKGLRVDLFEDNAITKIEETIGNKKIDVIIGGPPCQGFSLTGSRNFDDKRNKLYLTMFDAVAHFQPKAFMIENVPGMAKLYGGEVKEEIIRRFTNLGYNVVSQIVNAADYEVPQIRKRLVFIGLKNGYYDFPKPVRTPDNYITCEEAISDLPPLIDELGEETSQYSRQPVTDYQRQMRGTNNVLHNHVAINHKQFVKDVISQVPDGGNYKDLPVGVGESRIFHMAWTRYASNKPSRTIDTGHRNNFHYKYNRCPTVRESARLQSFPDDFVFVGNKTQQNRQVGNAVPVRMAFYIATQLKNYLDDCKNN